MDELSQFEGFDWDLGNLHKNWASHQVVILECEQIFFNQPLLLYKDLAHSDQEERYYALGMTDANRKLFVSFTMRNQHIRVISARDQRKKERSIYEQAA